MIRYLLILNLLLISVQNFAQVKDFAKISNSSGFNYIEGIYSGDNFGRSVANIGDLNDDGITDIAIGAHKSDENGYQKGAIHIIFMNENGTIQSTKKISNVEGGFTGTINDQDVFGVALAGLGDLDGDGVEDIAVGARLDDDGITDGGAVWILFMNQDGSVKNHQKISSTEGNFTASMADLASLGSSIDNLGDLDGDGIVDIIVGANRDDSKSNQKTGVAYILFLNSNGTVKSYKKITEGFNGFSSTLNFQDGFASGVANIGDIDGDNVIDVAIGSQYDDTANTDAGAIYIILLNSDGTVKNDVKISTGLRGFVSTLDAESRFGSSIVPAGDQNNDGIKEIIVGSFRDNENGDTEGAIWLLSINSSLNVVSEKKISSSLTDFNPILSPNSAFGISLANLGDPDGNGIDNILVGASENNAYGSAVGSSWILNFNSDSGLESYTLINSKYKLSSGDNFGRSVTNIGDLDDDGIEDYAVGANMSDEDGTEKGAVYILFMTSHNSIKTVRKISNLNGGFSGIINDSDLFGTSIESLGDLDGDGVEDLAVGARFDDDGTTDAGAIWILFLNSDGSVKSHQKISKAQGNFGANLGNLASFGTSITNLGDLDGDNVIDIAVGANRESSNNVSQTGVAYILFLNNDGTVKSHKAIGNGLNNFSSNLKTSDGFASSIANIGDIDGDNITDIAVGAMYDDEADTDAGAFYIITLNTDGTVKKDVKITAGLRGFTGTIDAEGRFGSSLTPVGDQNNDGVQEIIVGNFRDNENGNVEGALWLFSIDSNINVIAANKINSSSKDFNPTISPNSAFGNDVSNIGDIDGNGIDDILVGAPKDNIEGSEGGSAWILQLHECIAIAGNNQNLECNTFTTELNATPTSGTGEWTVISGSGDFADTSSPKSAITNLSPGTNTLKWTVTNGASSVSDVVKVVTTDYGKDPTIKQTGNTLEAISDATTYQWLMNGDSIANETSTILEITSDGIYQVAIKYDNGCERTSEQLQAVFTGLEKPNISEEFLIYPNPSSEVLNIELQLKKSTNYTFEFSNAMGQIIESNEGQSDYVSTHFNTSLLPNGIYFVKLKLNDEQFVYKVIINHR